MCLSLPNDSGFRVVDEGLKRLHSVRNKSQYLVEILTDPWNEKSATWEIYNKAEDWIEFSEPVLYDLEKDIGETTNLASQYPKIVKDLLKEIERARGDIGTGQQKGIGIRSFD